MSQALEVENRLREMILDMDIGPGERLTERWAEAQLGASRTPVRAALQRLEHGAHLFLLLLLGPDHVRLLPAAALSGGLFLIVADTVARTAFAPSEIPVGLLTALLGAPAFLYLLNRRQRSAQS